MIDTGENKEDKYHRLRFYYNKNNIASKTDDNYYQNLDKVRPKVATVEEMIEFYRMWFDIYEEVKKEWDDISD